MGSIINLILVGINLYSFVLIAYIFMSWIPNARESSFGQMIGRIAEPYLEIFRKIIPPFGMIDFSPIIAIFALNLASRGILELYYYFV